MDIKMKQITIFDVLESIEGKKTDVPCGYIDDLSLIGRELKFQELKDMIGKKCILTYATESHTWYKVIRITEYFENSDKVFRQVRDIPEGHLQYGDCINEYIHDVVGDKESMDCYEIDHICDRVGFVDQDKLKKSNSWLSEMYCSGGRWDPPSYLLFSEHFYELVL